MRPGREEGAVATSAFDMPERELGRRNAFISILYHDLRRRGPSCPQVGVSVDSA